MKSIESLQVSQAVTEKNAKFVFIEYMCLDKIFSIPVFMRNLGICTNSWSVTKIICSTDQDQRYIYILTQAILDL